MAGIYLHIPFCKQACHYCDFHFSTNLKPKNDLVDCLVSELILRANELHGGQVDSIYFGGGTPSLLESTQIELLIATINKHFEVNKQAEITLEANPDDLSIEKIRNLSETSINRFSVGIQSFDDEKLRWMNRAHSSEMAHQCLMDLKANGFENITADLIYAIPPGNLDEWNNDLTKLLTFDLPHISLYGLTVEENTVLGRRLQKGNLQTVSEEKAALQYEYAIETLTSKGYDHYEVSNFAKPGCYSKHNSSYWEEQHYLGIGPGAHSYDGQKRSFNISNNTRYINAIKAGSLPASHEILSATDKINEYILTRLRTKKGLDLQDLKHRHITDLLKDYTKIISQLEAEGKIKINENQLSLTSHGFLIADEIALRLFYDE